MGALRFQIPNADSFEPRSWETAHVTGMESIPWVCRWSLKDNQFIIHRDIEESGKLNLVWPSAVSGPVNLSTTSLAASPDPYLLPLELARGTVYRVRTQAFDWQRAGLKLSDSFLNLTSSAVEQFIIAATQTRSPNVSHEAASRAIDFALSSIAPLSESFVREALLSRRQDGKLNTLLGVNLGDVIPQRELTAMLVRAGNSIVVPLSWAETQNANLHSQSDRIDAQLDWARQNGLRVFGGPLISLQPHSVPAWLHLLDDFDKLIHSAVQYVEETVNRYRGRVHLWHCAAGMNGTNTLGLDDEQVLRLTVAVVQAVRRSDDRTPVIVSLDQPWCEYLSTEPNGISPLHFADALLRADLGISGIGLELNMGYWPGGSLPRDLLEIGRLFDRWAMLGTPLLALLRSPQPAITPTGTIVDATGGSNIHLDTENTSDTVDHKLSPLVRDWEFSSLPEYPASPSPSQWIIKSLLARPCVQGIIWNQLQDRSTSPYPESGLLTDVGVARPLMNEIINIRNQNIV